jgi:hypothetical protein
VLFWFYADVHDATFGLLGTCHERSMVEGPEACKRFLQTVTVFDRVLSGRGVLRSRNNMEAPGLGVPASRCSLV